MTLPESWDTSSYVYCIKFALSRLFFFLFHATYSLICSFKRRTFISTSDNPVLNWSGIDTARRIRNREVTAAEVLETYIARIEEVNSRIVAIVAKRYDVAREEARKVDERIEQINGEVALLDKLAEEKPLYGVPITIKEHIMVKGLPITAGIVARKDVIGDHDANLVSRLRAIGCIVVGVTNIPETLMFWECDNHLYGTTRNPHDLRRTTGGSSGGEAAAIASQLSCCGLGSDAGGSIRIPSAWTGIFGIKPTPKIINISFPDVHPNIENYPGGQGREIVLTMGPMAKYVEDLRVMYKALVDPANLHRLDLDKPIHVKNLKVFYNNGCKGPEMQNLTDEMRFAMNKALNHLEKSFDLRPVKVQFNDWHNLHEYMATRLDFGTAPTVWSVMQGPEGSCPNPPPFNLLSEVTRIALGKSDHTVNALMFCQIEQDRIEKRNETIMEKNRYLANRLSKEVQCLLGEDGVLVTPAFPTTAPFIKETTVNTDIMYTVHANVLGLPAISIPMGYAGKDKLPVAVQITAAPYCERNLFAIAEELEKAFGGWVKVQS